MKCTIPEISWHNREPVLSVDIHPESKNFYKVATGGGDCHVLIWQMNICDNGAVKQEVISDLTRHQRAVNCVRWAPSGQYLASGDDDSNIIIWQLKTDNIPLLEGDTGDKEIWIVYKVLRGHKEDVYDLCWSIDSGKLLSGSVDNTAILWDLTKGKIDHILSEHKGFVQGVAWDPKNELIATLSTDRVCRLFDTTGKQVKARISKGVLQVHKDHFLHEKEVKYFHDDTFKSFFRRLQFSPDGSLLIVPSGHIDSENCKQILNATMIFTMDNLTVPAAILPLKKQSSTVVRCCPAIFELHDDGPAPLVDLPYRLIFAVGTDHDVLLYDTQQQMPFARFQDIHYTRLTDLTWSSDGQLLVAASTDGFCCLITFEKGELGKPYVEKQIAEEGILDISGCEELLEVEENSDSNKEVKKCEEVEVKKRPSFMEKWALKTPKKRKMDNSVCSDTDMLDKSKNEDQQMEKEDTEKIVECGKQSTFLKDLAQNSATDNTILLKDKVIEIDDSEEEKDIQNHDEYDDVTAEEKTKIKEEISKLFCHSKKPEVNTRNDASAAKLIAVRRKPKTLEPEGNAKNEDVKKQESNKSNINDAKPIEVRRKPRVAENGSDVKKTEDSKIETINNDAKPIKVRRKPKINEKIVDKKEQTDKEAKLEKVAKEDSKNKESQIGCTEIESSKEVKRTEIKKPISFLQQWAKSTPPKKKQKNEEKNVNLKVDIDVIEISDSPQKNDISPKKIRKIVPIKIAEVGQDSGAKQGGVLEKNKMAKTKAEQESPQQRTKIKVSSLVKKKIVDENKSSPFCKAGKKSKSLKRESLVELAILEEAQDGWKCGEKSGKTEKNIKPTENDIEDCTEDFTLQLEESQDSTKNEDPEQQTSKKRKIEDDNCTETIEEKSSNECIKNIDKIDNLTQKIPRRVQLITISSPKGKKKP